jgi:hypothetical protein
MAVDPTSNEVDPAGVGAGVPPPVVARAEAAEATASEVPGVFPAGVPPRGEKN